jgi:hypothetical protein
MVMSIQKFAVSIELNFWRTIITAMDEEGLIMKLSRYLYRLIHTKFGYFLLLVIVWGSVGFTFGLLLGRILSLFNLI